MTRTKTPDLSTIEFEPEFVAALVSLTIERGGKAPDSSQTQPCCASSIDDAKIFNMGA